MDGGRHNFSSEVTAKETLQGLLRTQYGLNAKAIDLSSTYSDLTESFSRISYRKVRDALLGHHEGIKQQFIDAEGIFIPQLPSFGLDEEAYPDLLLCFPDGVSQYKTRYYSNIDTEYNPLSEKQVWNKINQLVV